MKPQIQGFEVMTLLGTGAMSTVWRARRSIDGRLVALKVLHPHSATSPNMVARFLHEVRAYERLQHPNVITCVGGGCDADQWFVALELLEAGSLRAVLRDVGRLPAETAAFVLCGILSGLGHAHSRGLFHRDVKPENVMLAGDGTPKLADFGIASGVDVSHLTEVGQLVGTPAYMAPEQVRDGVSDARSDLWSCGVLLYEMVCGVNPFAADTREGTLERVRGLYPAPFAYRMPVAGTELDEALQRLLVRDPDRRVQSATEALRLLEPLVARSPSWASAAAVKGLLTSPAETITAWAEEHAANRLDAARSSLRMSEPRHAAAFIEAAEALAVDPRSAEAEALVAALAPRVGAGAATSSNARIDNLVREAESSAANVQALVQLVRVARASGDVLLATRAYRWGRLRSAGDRFAHAQLASALGFELAGHIERRPPESLRSSLQGSGAALRRDGETARARPSWWLWIAAVVLGAVAIASLWHVQDPDGALTESVQRPRAESRTSAEAAVFLDRARGSLERGDAPRARTILDGFLERWPAEPRTPEALFLLGCALEELQDATDAIETYASLLARFPRDDRAVAARRRLARLRATLGQLDLAALELEPLRDAGDLEDRASVRLALAKLYTDLHRYDEALAMYDLVLDPTAPAYLRPDALLGRGRVQLARGDVDALRSLAEAARLAGPNTAIARAAENLIAGKKP